MRGIKFGVVVLCVLVLLTGCQPTEPPVLDLTLQEKIEDFDYLFQVITENYPFLGVNKRVNGVDWEVNYETYLEKVKATETDEEFFEAMGEILRDLNNGHTHMLDSNMAKRMRDLYFQISQEELYKDNWRQLQFETLNHQRAVERYGMGVLDASSPATENQRQDLVRNAVAQDLVPGKIAYISIPRMIQSHQRELDEMLISRYLRQISSHQTLVIDIRGNGGGDSSYWHDFLVPRIIDEIYYFESFSFFREGEIVSHVLNYNLDNELKNHDIQEIDREQLPNLPQDVYQDFAYYNHNRQPIEPSADTIGFQGNIYLLVDRGVYSSAEMFAVFAKDSGFATLIGERTAGDGLGVDPLFAMLPNSGFIFRFSWILGTTSDGSVNEEHQTTPHFEVNATRYGGNMPLVAEDRAVQKVLELEGLDWE